MKKILILTSGLAIACAFTRMAAATPLIDNSCQGISCNTDNSTNQTTTNSNAAAAAATGGSATNVNAPVTVNTNTAKGGDAKVDHSGNSFNVNDVDVHNSVRSENKNANIQGQKQKQKQSQEAYSSSRSSVKESGNSNVEINDIDRRQTPPAYAPALVASSETCVQSQSAGGSSPVFGFSLGITHSEEGCNMRRNAGMLFALGAKGAAIELLCSDDDVRAAMKAAGTPCAGDRVQEAPMVSLQDGAEAARIAAFEPMQPVRDDK